MRILLLILLGMSILASLLIVENAFAQSGTFQQSYIQLGEYHYGNPIGFFGAVPHPSLNPVTISILEPCGITEVYRTSVRLGYMTNSPDRYSVTIPKGATQWDRSGNYHVSVFAPNYFESSSFLFHGKYLPFITSIHDPICIEELEGGRGGGCLIATATFGSELAPQVQQLRELRDNSLLQTESGTSFMNIFNNFYYSFSPVIADLERENPLFKEAVKLAITPMISSLSILNYANMDSEAEVLGYGISLILLNVGMYVGIPAIVIVGIRKRF